METEKLLKILTDLCALPPDGKGALEILSAYATERDSLCVDALGSVIWSRGAAKNSPNGHSGYLIEAHIDTIAMIVTAVLPGGFLRVQPVGGVDRRPLPAASVNVWGKNKSADNKPCCSGIIVSTPPHLKEKDAPQVPDWMDILVDVNDCVNDISPGDLISLHAPPITLLNNTVTAAGLDNRAGCAALLQALLLTQDCPQPVTAVFAVQEETNGAGAATAAYAANESRAIVVDVSFAQAPEVNSEMGGKLGGGTMLGVCPVLDSALTEKLQTTACREEIPLQFEVMGAKSGTDADKIQAVRRGIPTALLSIPLRNMHTAAEIVSLIDIHNTAKLISLMIRDAGDNNNA